ncbi:phenylalanine--tRNA ligase subunit beta [Mycoplasmopsis phocirhinis]|uniref:Phenylalanine--tRNA ligase beta subunit n=1 Tax=Mycoplasmopsis phocirhinis TaxID=142650 RepID=A0A4V0ZAG6_9BACT|nr:phenylalanine--tRNA ligase subunit beta [Mycoplasmopsis phocirhinis]QBF34632.1 phenylalanine--tRNA ligase subunit beta [Mycoplasmopsis phocirhinis]
MIITLKELNKFLPNINLDLSVEKAINNLGYEVETITPFSKVKGVKFAKVINVYANQNSQNLTVVELELDKGQKITIQTTAKNAKIGAYTTAFVEGSTNGEIVYGVKKMAGIESQGMLASFAELGFDVTKLPFNEQDLIMLDHLPLDVDPVQYFNLDDYIIDISTPANRSDANSYFVLARELAAYYNTEFKWFDWDNKKIKQKFKARISSKKNEQKALALMELQHKNSKTSLLDMLFLAKHGVDAKGIWAIDVSNLTLLYTGAPTHAYDRNKISSRLCAQIYSGEVEILGNKKMQVKNVLSIQDGKNVISLAALMGAQNSAVSENTNLIAFEIGAFDHKLIRHGAKEIKMETSSSIQAGRIINTQMVRFGMKYLQYKAFIDKNQFSNIVGLPAVKKGVSVLQNRKKLAIYANCEIGELKKFNHVENQLLAIGFKIDKNRIIAPNYRHDIEHYEDIIEEYFRFYGYDNFKAIAPNLSQFKVTKRDISKSLLVATGYSEVRTFTLENEQNNWLNPFNFQSTISLETFVSKEREQIRNSIITSMLQVVEFNFKRKIENINIFEKGMINYNQYSLGLISNTKTFNQIKQDIINYLKINSLTFVPFDDNEYINPNLSAKIMFNEQMIGWIGKIHPRYSNLDVWVAEFKEITNEDKIVFQPYNPNPLKTLDITFELNKNVSINQNILDIKNNFAIFEIQKIDEYHTQTSKKITLRITADSETIDLINQKYN